MKIVAISDMHGKYDFEIPEADILCICGDIVPLYIQTYMEKSLQWFEDEFLEWCMEQPVDHIYLIGGNHDFFLSRFPNECRNIIEQSIARDKVSYLFDNFEIYHSEADNKDYKIYGTPWCHMFGPWAFMIPDTELEKKFELIPEDIDILLTHDAPYGRTDLLLQTRYHMAKGHIGNKPMAKRLEKISPRLHFTGHLHSCNHVPTMYNGTNTVCVSMLDEDYELNYKPFLITI